MIIKITTTTNSTMEFDTKTLKLENQNHVFQVLEAYSLMLASQGKAIKAVSVRGVKESGSSIKTPLREGCRERISEALKFYQY